jgi:hypothetical protein
MGLRDIVVRRRVDRPGKKTRTSPGSITRRIHAERAGRREEFVDEALVRCFRCNAKWSGSSLRPGECAELQRGLDAAALMVRPAVCKPIHGHRVRDAGKEIGENLGGKFVRRFRRIVGRRHPIAATRMLVEQQGRGRHSRQQTDAASTATR